MAHAVQKLERKLKKIDEAIGKKRTLDTSDVDLAFRYLDVARVRAFTRRTQPHILIVRWEETSPLVRRVLFDSFMDEKTILSYLSVWRGNTLNPTYIKSGEKMGSLFEGKDVRVGGGSCRMVPSSALTRDDLRQHHRLLWSEVNTKPLHRHAIKCLNQVEVYVEGGNHMKSSLQDLREAMNLSVSFRYGKKNDLFVEGIIQKQGSRKSVLELTLCEGFSKESIDSFIYKQLNPNDNQDLEEEEDTMSEEEDERKTQTTFHPYSEQILITDAGSICGLPHPIKPLLLSDCVEIILPDDPSLKEYVLCLHLMEKAMSLHPEKWLVIRCKKIATDLYSSEHAIMTCIMLSFLPTDGRGKFCKTEPFTFGLSDEPLCALPFNPEPFLIRPPCEKEDIDSLSGKMMYMWLKNQSRSTTPNL